MRVLQTALLVTVLDQLVKWCVTENMELGETIPFVKDVFHLTYIINPGAAFGLFPEQRFLFLAMVAVLFIAFFMGRNRIPKEPVYFMYGIGLLLGGAMGNAIDRVRIEGVIDFFDFRFWPIFNVADIAICAGIGLIGLYCWRET